MDVRSFPKRKLAGWSFDSERNQSQCFIHFPFVSLFPDRWLDLLIYNLGQTRDIKYLGAVGMSLKLSSLMTGSCIFRLYGEMLGGAGCEYMEPTR